MSKRRPAPALPAPQPQADGAPRWLAAALLVVTCATFARVLPHDFCWIDDAFTISANERLNPPTLANVGFYWGHAELALYIPVTYTVWAGLAWATYVPTPDEYGRHLDPHVFHAASVLLHAAAVLAVYGLLRRLLRHPWAASGGALLFGLHPLQVEAVAWASGMKDLLYGCLSIAALLLYVRSLRAGYGPDAPVATRPRAGWYALATAALAAALLSKPTAMITPLLAATIDLGLLRRPARRVAAALWPWALIALPVAFVAKHVQPGLIIASPPIWQRPVVAGASLAFYLGKLLWPARLTFDYGWQPLYMLAKPWFWGIALVPVAIAAGLWLARRRSAWPGVAGLVSVVALLPVSGLAPFHYQFFTTVTDHYAYLAMLGPAMLAAWGLSRVTAGAGGRSAIVAGGVLLVLTGVSWRTIGFWRDTVTSCRHALEVNPRSLSARSGLGSEYANAGDYEAAERILDEAIAMNANYVAPRKELAMAEVDQGHVEAALAQVRELRAIDRRVLGIEADHSDFLGDLAHRALARGQLVDAARLLEEYARLKPNDPMIRASRDLAREQLRRAAAATRPGATAPSTPPATAP